MRYLQFYEGVREKHAAKLPRVLRLRQHGICQVRKLQDGTRCAKQGSGEVQNQWRKNLRGQDAHVKIQANSQTSDKHEPCSVAQRLFSICLNHLHQQVSVSVSLQEACVRICNDALQWNGMVWHGDEGAV
jgi:hypothetical protein